MNIKVSIVIPCRNEEKYIGKCLESIIQSNYDKKNLEVFVCDGMSTDRTREILNEISKKYLYINILNNLEKSTPFGLNLGLKISKGDIKIILGAHSEIYPDYIEKCIEIFEYNQEIGCTGGIITPYFTVNKAHFLIETALKLRYRHTF